MFEPHSAPLVPRAVFLRRLAVHGGYVAALLGFSIVMGIVGFHYLAGQEPIDALLNSAMLLGGMGPVGEIRFTAGKLFASFYSLYAGLVFIGGSTILLAPVLHRFMHRFHLEDEGQERFLTGRHLVLQALAAGHDVTVLVRHPDRLPVGSERARVVTGDATDGTVLRQAVPGHDAVISTLGVGNSLKSNGLITKAAPAVVEAMTRAGVRRLVWTSAYGVGETYRDTPLIPRIIIAVMLRDLYADKAAGEAAIRSSQLDWTLVHPSTLSKRPGKGRYRSGERLKLRGLPTISRPDVANFLVTQLDDRSYSRKSVLISD